MLKSYKYHYCLCATVLASSLALSALTDDRHGFDQNAFGAGAPTSESLLAMAADANAATPFRKNDFTAHQGALLVDARAIEVLDAMYRSIKSAKAEAV